MRLTFSTRTSAAQPEWRIGHTAEISRSKGQAVFCLRGSMRERGGEDPQSVTSRYGMP